MLQHAAKCDCDRYWHKDDDGDDGDDGDDWRIAGAARDRRTANMHKN